MDSIKLSPHHLRESSLDILRGAINRYTHITDKQHQWTLLTTQSFPRSSQIQVYKRTGGASEIYKIVLDITTRADRTWTLNSWHALFQCVGTRKLWDQMMDAAQVLDRPDSSTFITQRVFKGNDGCIFAERTTRKPNSIRHVSTPTTSHDDTAACPALAGYDIRISPDDDPNLDSRVTFYYEIVSPILSPDALESYVLSLVTGPLSTLALHGSPPDVLREPEHAVQRLEYDTDLRLWELEYQVKPIQPGSEPASPSSAVHSINISRKSSLSQWPHNSWDRSTSSLQLASSLRHRRGSFMGSLLLPPTSASYSTMRPKPLLSLYDAERSPDIAIEFDSKTWAAGRVDVELTVHVQGFGELDCKMIDQFAQLCIRCYAERRDERYFMTLYHPPQLVQYLMEGRDWIELLERPQITVKLQVMPKDMADGFGVFVNGKEWPFHSWMGDQLFSDESSDDNIDSEDDHDVFVNDMDDDPIETPSIDLPPMVPSHSEKTALSIEQETPSDPVSVVEEEKEHKEEVLDDEQKSEESEEGEAEDVMVVPETDPEPVLKMRNYFESLIQSNRWRILQPPEPSNLFVTIKKIDVPGHPSGAYLSESIWKDCSIWDVKAIVNCIGTRKIWDSTYEDGVFLRQISKTCSLWHHKMKGFWTVSARDYVAFTSAYTSGSRIDLCATSCTSDIDQYAIPMNTPGYVRARLDLWNWRIERLDPITTSVKLINQANPQGWIPSYVPNSLSGHNTDIVMRAYQFFKKHGSPPDLTLLEHGTLINVSYDHHRASWRCEYTLSTDGSCTLAEVRLRKRGYNVVIDPPPSSVKASARTHDPYGVWIEIGHKETDIIPQRGRILLLIKPSDSDQLVINGDVTVPNKDLQKSIRLKEKSVDVEEETVAEPEPIPEEIPPVPEQDDEEKGLESTIQSLPVSPVDLAQSALTFLTRVSDQQFGWSSVLDKNGLKISKRSGTTKLADTSAESIMKAFMNEQMEIPEPSVIVKASKVIEGFSLEEVASIVTNTGNLRKHYDESVEEIEALYRTRNGCQIVRQLVKGIFPFKSREIFVSACTAHERIHSTTNPSAKRILYVEASIPNYPVADPSKRPQALFSLSGWILEAIDPYTTTTNHPIPSMRATCLASLDLGSSVPTYMSNLVTMGLPKRMKAIEKLLHSQGPPPYLGHPFVAQLFLTGKLIDELSIQGPIEWTKVNTSYDTEKYVFQCDTKFQLLSSPQKQSTIGSVPSKSNLSTSLLKSKQSMAASSGSSNISSSSSSVMSGVSNSPKPARLVKEQPPLKPTQRETLMRVIIDLRNYKKGYEVVINMRCGEEKDVSSMLSVNVSELAPEPSHLIANTNGEMPRKHAVQVATTSLLTHDKEYALELQLIPVTEECLNKRGTRLTVSGVLGEDDGQWHGMVLLNGKEIQVGSTVDVAVAAAAVESPVLQENDLPTTENDAVDDESVHDESISMLGGGVVAAALGGVSASVNQIQDFRARMLLPFRQASSSFLSSTPAEDDDLFESPISSPSHSSDDEKDATVISPSVMHRRSRLRSTSDVAMRRPAINKSGFLVMICILLLLLLLTVLIRAPPSEEVLDIYIGARRIRQLWKIPWFAGWHVEIIAVHR
ncbi:hypothetical protein BJV82DRAFT_611917 [Fennellomyces sp. T-0311]|nr:hypothetical protein BJV82DRAFT_611917 [Fennellomyces sp. T-0311]